MQLLILRSLQTWRMWKVNKTFTNHFANYRMISNYKGNVKGCRCKYEFVLIEKKTIVCENALWMAWIIRIYCFLDKSHCHFSKIKTNAILTLIHCGQLDTGLPYESSSQIVRIVLLKAPWQRLDTLLRIWRCFEWVESQTGATAAFFTQVGVVRGQKLKYSSKQGISSSAEHHFDAINVSDETRR